MHYERDSNEEHVMGQKRAVGKKSSGFSGPEQLEEEENKFKSVLYWL